MSEKSLKIKIALLIFFSIFTLNTADAGILKNDIEKEISVLEKKLSSLNTQCVDYNKSSLDITKKIFELHIQNNDKITALKTADELLECTKNVYGLNSIEYSNELLNQFYLNIDKKYPKKAKEILSELSKNAEKLNNHKLNRDYYKALSAYFATFQSSFKEIDALNGIIDYYQISNDEKLELIFKYALAYHGTYNIVDTKKYFNDYYKLSVKLKGKNNPDLISYYHSLLMFKLIVENDYNSFNDLYVELVKLIEKHNSSIETKLFSESILLRYYFATKQFDKAKTKIDSLYEEHKTIKDKSVKSTIDSFYLTYYSSIGDVKNSRRYLKRQLKTVKKNYGNDSVEQVFYKEALVDYNKSKGNFKKANEISLEILEFLKQYENEIPVIYGKFLKNMALVKRDMKEFETALGYLYASEAVYKKELPEISYPLYETAIEFAILYRLNNKFEEAISYYNKALKICNKLFGEYHNDCLKVQQNIAETYYYWGHKKESLVHIDKAIKISQKIYGKDSVVVKELIQKRTKIEDNSL